VNIPNIPKTVGKTVGTGSNSMYYKSVLL
jgi:hypothetical protein